MPYGYDEGMESTGWLDIFRTDVLLGATFVEFVVRAAWAAFGSGLALLGSWGLRRRVKALETKPDTVGPTVNVNIGNEVQRAPQPEIIDHGPQVTSSAAYPSQTTTEDSTNVPPQIPTTSPSDLADYLKIFEGRTDLAAQTIIKPHLKKRMTVTGGILNIREGFPQEYITVVLENRNCNRVYLKFDAKKWAEYFIALGKNAKITAEGTLIFVDYDHAILDDCTLVSQVQ